MIPINPHLRQRRIRRFLCVYFTLAELMVAVGMASPVLVAMMSFGLFSASRIKSGQKQMLFNYKGRFGAERLTQAIQLGRMVTATTDGLTVYVVNADGHISQVWYADADANPATIGDNNIWIDPDVDIAGDTRVLIPYVTPITGQPVFAILNGALFARFHVGDAAPYGAESDRFSGRGYQGLQIRFVAKPRNIGQVWTGGGF